MSRPAADCAAATARGARLTRNPSVSRCRPHAGADGTRPRLAYLRHRFASSADRLTGAARAAQHRATSPALPYRAARIGTIAALRLLRRITAWHRDCRGHPTLQ
ncbi:ABC-type amino acid transport/signal transduction system, periplasmic component/domain protein [Burkholderia cepacia]|nr:ABC-type amino acid transport/signal transduction system, periplasmic component/domain protein [Burkholderia cepacia]